MTQEIKIVVEIPGLDKLITLLSAIVVDSDAPAGDGTPAKPGRKPKATGAAATQSIVTPLTTAVVPATATVVDPFAAPPAAAKGPDPFAPAAEPAADEASLNRLRAILGPIIQCDRPDRPIRADVKAAIEALGYAELPQVPKSKYAALLTAVIAKTREKEIKGAELQTFDPAIIDKLTALNKELGLA